MTVPKRMNFWKSSEGGGGGGSFSIQKFILQILDLYTGLFGKKLQYGFPKIWVGGTKAVWNFSESSSVLVP